ncbi:MAG: hypothetical protein AAFX85_14885, partial [Pseudomonadota bacterium]
MTTARPLWLGGVALLAVATVLVAAFPAIDLAVSGWFYDPMQVGKARFWSNEQAPVSWIYHGVQRGSLVYG